MSAGKVFRCQIGWVLLCSCRSSELHKYEGEKKGGSVCLCVCMKWARWRLCGHQRGSSKVTSDQRMKRKLIWEVKDHPPPPTGASSAFWESCLSALCRCNRCRTLRLFSLTGVRPRNWGFTGTPTAECWRWIRDRCRGLGDRDVCYPLTTRRGWHHSSAGTSAAEKWAVMKCSQGGMLKWLQQEEDGGGGWKGVCCGPVDALHIRAP